MMTTNTARVALPSDGSGARFTARGLAVPIWLAGKAMLLGEDHAHRYSALGSKPAFEGS